MSSQPMLLNAMQNIIQRRRQDQAQSAQRNDQSAQMAHEERMQGQRIGAAQQQQGMGMAENAVQAMEARDLMKQQVAQRQAAEAAQRQHEMTRDLEAGKQRMQEQFTRNDFETKQSGVKMGHEKELAEMDDSRAFMERRARSEAQSANLAHEADQGAKSRWNAREIATGHDDTRENVEAMRQKIRVRLHEAALEAKRGGGDARAAVVRAATELGKGVGPLNATGKAMLDKMIASESFKAALAAETGTTSSADDGFSTTKTTDTTTPTAQVEIIEAPDGSGRRARRYPDGRIEPIAN